MLIYWNKRKHLHEKGVKLPEDFLGTPTWSQFHCFGTLIWLPRRHVKRSIECFLHDVTAAILVAQNNETVAMLVSQTSPVGVELFSYANAFFCSNKFA